MIEGSIYNGKYPLEDVHQKHLSKYVRVINRSETDDLKSSEIKIEVRLQSLYSLNNYVAEIEHLPGIIELDVLDSFKMLCRRVTRIHVTTEKNKDVMIPTGGRLDNQMDASSKK
jgi:hypothetical protein